MKRAPVTIGAAAAIAVGIFVALSVSQASRPADINFVEAALQDFLPYPVVRLFPEP
jgi:hypothetical protein